MIDFNALYLKRNYRFVTMRTGTISIGTRPETNLHETAGLSHATGDRANIKTIRHDAGLD